MKRAFQARQTGNLYSRNQYWSSDKLGQYLLALIFSLFNPITAAAADLRMCVAPDASVAAMPPTPTPGGQNSAFGRGRDPLRKLWVKMKSLTVPRQAAERWQIPTETIHTELRARGGHRK
jgi:hypothetical protein